MKKIIIVLTIIVLVLGLVFILITQRKKATIKPTDNEAFPTGILLPQSKISPNSLDIISIDPIDQSKDVDPQKMITVQFNKKVEMKNIGFFIDPNTEYSLTIDNDKLIIKPINSWQNGTNYKFSINFTADNQKVRLYSFTTKGDLSTNTELPDTQPTDLQQLELQEQKKEAPDVYVANHTPYEAKTFSVTMDFEPNPPAHMYFKVTPKSENKELVKQNVMIWLQLLDLTDSQIKTLDVRYQ